MNSESEMGSSKEELGMYEAHSCTDAISQSLLHQLLIALLLVMLLTDLCGATVTFTFSNTVVNSARGRDFNDIFVRFTDATQNFVCLGLATHAGEVQVECMRRCDANYTTKSPEIRMPVFSLSPFLALMFVAFRNSFACQWPSVVTLQTAVKDSKEMRWRIMRKDGPGREQVTNMFITCEGYKDKRSGN